MDRRVLGRTGMEVSPLGFGGAEIGFERAQTFDVARLLGAALDAGLNVIENAAAEYAIACGAFDTLQTSVNIADQRGIETTLPKAVEAGMGIIAKRPIANVAWRYGSEAECPAYPLPYYRRLKKLDYPFLSGPDAVGVALRFTLAQPGVATAIVGTKNPDRWAQNAALLQAGPLEAAEVEAIRERWRAVAAEDWVGQV